jgi:FkbM family methyltransferase
MQTFVNNDVRKMSYVGDLYLWARRGETGVTGNIYVGLHEFEDMAFVAHLLRPGDLFADIGANAGSYTVLAAGFAGTGVVAVEPAPDAFARLEANIRLNRLEHLVQAKRCVVGAHIGPVRFSTDQDTLNHVLGGGIAWFQPSIEVDMFRLDDLFARRAPQLIKIDVEGSEADVLHGAAELLADPDLKSIIVELWQSAGSDAVDVLEAAGFARAKYDPFKRRLHFTRERQAGNTLFVRDNTWIEDRISAAPLLRVKGISI